MIAGAQNQAFSAVSGQKSDVPQPPKRLRTAGRRFWEAVWRDFLIEPHQVELLTFAAVQADRVDQAARRYAKAVSRREQERALAAERAGMRTFQVLRRELSLDAPAKEQRGPRGGLYT